MQAVVVSRFGGSEVLSLVDAELPQPGPHQLLVKVRYASLNFADVMARQGNYHGGGQPPFVPGLDLYGSVVEVGESVQRSWIGRRVIGFPSGGSYQQYAVCDESMVIEAPENVPEEQLGAAPLVLCTALGLLERSGGSLAGLTTVTYAAAGGVGLTLLQLLHHAKVGRNIAIVGSESKAQIALEHHATDAVVHTKSKVDDSIRSITGNQGVDIIYNSVAGTTASDDLAVLSPFGRLLMYGMAAGSPAIYASNLLHPTSRSIIGFSFGSVRRLRPELVQGLLERSVRVLESGEVRFDVTKVFDLASVAAAHDLLETGASTGKLLLSFD
jgi:NADPH2:quinone reductase